MNGPRIPQNHDHKTEARLRSYPKVLVFVETMYSKLGRDIAELLVHTRIKYKVEVAGKSLPVLTNLDKGRYGVIVFENFNKYLQMDKWNRELLDKYCREYFVGMIGFITPEEETLVGSQLKGFPLFIHTNLKLKVKVSRTGEILYKCEFAGCRFERGLANPAPDESGGDRLGGPAWKRLDSFPGQPFHLRAPGVGPQERRLPTHRK
jgi:hypothetical protein